MKASRRGFFRLAGASLAMAATACERPKDKIVPYVVQPEDTLPGSAVYYATSMELDAVAIGLLVESHEGRPTKVEGNPGHPGSLGGTGIFEQAAILDLYDPRRARAVTQDGVVRSFRMCAAMLTRRIAQLRRGEGLVVMVAATGSPLIERQVRKLRAALPGARVGYFDPLGRRGAWEGTRAVFGRPLEPRWDVRRARAVATFDADVLSAHPGNVAFARGFTDGRRVRTSADAMNRLHVVETAMTVTGGTADHRAPLPPRAIPAALAGLLGEVVRRGTPVPDGVRARLAALVGPAHAFCTSAARDLERGGVVVAGAGQPGTAHAVAGAVNALVAGDLVSYGPPNALEAGEPEIDPRGAEVLVVLGGNPIFAGREVGPIALYLGPTEDETARGSTWVVPESHFLEAWGDARAVDGTVSIVQPLIAPLHGGKTKAEVLALLAGDARDGHALLREVHPELDDETLARGFIPGSAPAPVPVRVDWGAVAEAGERAIHEAGGTAFEIATPPDARVHDGRFAGNAWLEELPDPVTKLTWGHALQVGPRTARDLGVEDGDVVEVGGLTLPVMVVRGHAEGCGTIPLGYRSANAFRLRKDGAPPRKTGAKQRLAVAQVEQSPHGRDIVRSAPLAHYREEPRFAAREPRKKSLYLLAPSDRQQWAMSIDLTACTGCSACVIACQAENNVPVVGRDGVAHGRAMHWLRIDRYVDGSEDAPRVEVMPMLCQHCEKAPCEYVCPVGATNHSSDGLNQMVYPRCVGTRFCSNNCPYKVRRFNWFDYHKDEGPVRALANNPDVTVRGRGVMEKCTFCVQRIRDAERTARLEDRALRDGDVVTACAQVCPTGAITFGSLTTRPSRVEAEQANERTYTVLEELGTLPRVTYLARLRNTRGEKA